MLAVVNVIFCSIVLIGLFAYAVVVSHRFLCCLFTREKCGPSENSVV